MDFRAKVLIVHFIALLPILLLGAYGSSLTTDMAEGLLESRTRERVEGRARVLEASSATGGGLPARTSARHADVEVATPPGVVASRIYLVDPARGSVVRPGGPRIAPGGTPADSAMAVAAATSDGLGGRILSPSGERTFVFSRALVGAPWVVVGLASLDDVTGVWSMAGNAYLLFVLLLGLAAAGGFLVALRPLLQTVDDLTEAAAHVGHDDGTPWLPPATDGEAGRLSQAAGTMVSRVESMRLGIERNARLAMVGELATYLAHEIRNPLSSIRLNLQSVARDLDAGAVPGDMDEVTDLCLREIRRLDRVATSVLQVGRQRPPEPAPNAVHDTLRRAASVLTPELSRRRISLELDLAAPRDRCSFDSESLHSAVLALLMNAAEAVGQDGRIHLSTGLSEEDDGSERLLVELADSGPGVPPDLRRRIFEPFFTTKEEGTGIGLATATEALQANGGTLRIAERDGWGACFQMSLPLLPEPALHPVGGLV